MDWSLVLASQGIEALIQEDPETGRFGLVVPREMYGNAREAIELYRRENRHWRWRRLAVRGGLVFDWSCLLWVLLLCLFYAMADLRPVLKDSGVMESGAVGRGEVWRLATAVWLHADLGHLASNAALGVVLLGLVMGRFGPGVGLLAAYLSGIGGNMAVWLLPFGHGSLGASGLVMGSLGLLAAGRLGAESRRAASLRWAMRGVLAGVLLFVLVGLSPETDVRAHAGGFFSGVLLGVFLGRHSKLIQGSRLNFAAGALFCLLVIIPWAFAFKAFLGSS